MTTSRGSWIVGRAMSSIRKFSRPCPYHTAAFIEPPESGGPACNLVSISANSATSLAAVGRTRHNPRRRGLAPALAEPRHHRVENRSDHDESEEAEPDLPRVLVDEDGAKHHRPQDGESIDQWPPPPVVPGPLR